MPVVEIAQFPASAALLTDIEVLEAPFKILRQAPGYIRSFAGIQIEDKKTVHLAVAWESVEHHKQLINHESYGPLREELGKAMAGPIDILHVDFSADTTNAFSAPVTEIATMKLKEGMSKEDIETKAGKLCQLLDALKESHPPSAWGKTVEHADTYVLVAGWSSPEAHAEAVKASAIQSLLGEVYALGDIKIVHTSLHKRD